MNTFTAAAVNTLTAATGLPPWIVLLILSNSTTTQASILILRNGVLVAQAMATELWESIRLITQRLQRDGIPHTLLTSTEHIIDGIREVAARVAPAVLDAATASFAFVMDHPRLMTDNLVSFILGEDVLGQPSATPRTHGLQTLPTPNAPPLLLGQGSVVAEDTTMSSRGDLENDFDGIHTGMNGSGTGADGPVATRDRHDGSIGDAMVQEHGSQDGVGDGTDEAAAIEERHGNVEAEQAGAEGVTDAEEGGNHVELVKMRCFRTTNTGSRCQRVSKPRSPLDGGFDCNGHDRRR